MHKYKVSIILPCYNVSKYIVRCINSILSQDFDSYEIIIIDDGSTDNLIEICQQWKYKDNFFIYSFKNQGLSQARNEGIKVSQGEYIYFMDPDDYIEKNLLSVCYNLCKKEGVDAVQFRYDSEDEYGNKMWSSNGNKRIGFYNSDEIFKELLPRFIGYSNEDLYLYGTKDFGINKEMTSVWRFFYKSSIIKNNNISFPKGVKLIEDKIFNSYFFCYAKRIYIINNVLYHYVVKASGLMYSSILNPNTIVKDKTDAIIERFKIEELYKKVLCKDISNYYVGSVILITFELLLKLSCLPLPVSRLLMQKFDKLSIVRRAFREVKLSNCNLKVIIALLSYKYFGYTVLLSFLRAFNKLRNAHEIRNKCF